MLKIDKLVLAGTPFSVSMEAPDETEIIVWIEGRGSVIIRVTGEGISSDIYPLPEYGDEAITSCYALNDDLHEIEGAKSVGPEDVTHHFERGFWAVEWEWIGEGNEGNYDPEDPQDRKLLRATVLHGTPCQEGMQWLPVEEGSYCTLAEVHTPVAKLEELSNYLLDKCLITYDGVVDFDKKAMMRWTWGTDSSAGGT